MTATRAPHPIPLSIRAEDLLIAAAIIAALGDRPGRAHLHKLADRLDRCARVCWRQQYPEGEDVNGSPWLKPGDFNLKLHPKPRKEDPDV